jgi:DnaK suppressor protein
MTHEPAEARQALVEDPGSPAGPARVKFDTETLRAIKNTLLGQREELEEQLQTEEQAFRSTPAEELGEVRADENPAEAGTATFEREKHFSIANNVQDLIVKSSKALNKIEAGSYGLCESCGKPISADRLEALPHALMCIECKKAEERR